jgi:predicted dehydrogenase
MTNLGAHHLDIVDWFLGLGGLKNVMSTGGRLVLQDGGETPDTQDALFDCGHFLASCHIRECSRGENLTPGLEFFGTNGSLSISRSGFKLTPDAAIPAVNQIPGIGSHPVGGPQPADRTAARTPRTEAVEDKSGDNDEQYRGHVRNFLDCIHSRAQPVSNLESAHRTSVACHLANLSLRLGRGLRWDASAESILQDPEAQAGLVRPYRSPWDRELSALGLS